MALLDKLERVLGRFAIPNVSLYLVVGQVAVLACGMLRLINLGALVLMPELALAGQWWRIFSFLFVPPTVPTGIFDYVFLAFAWWIFYFMGTALEQQWGTFRFNLFLLLGFVLTVGLSFLQPLWPVTNAFLAGSVFLAFAYLNPNFEFLLLFFLPVKIKWLALLTWVLYAIQFAMGSWSVRLQIAAATGNFLLFFAPDAWRRAGAVRRRASWAAHQAPERSPDDSRHRCRVCGKTDKTNPELDFRYCSKCAGAQCYCPEHMFNHEHVRSEDEPAAGD